MFKRKPHLSEVDYTKEFDDDQKNLIMTSMSENLNHVRHVENERMSLLVGTTALIAGVLSVCSVFISEALTDVADGRTWEAASQIAITTAIFLITLAMLRFAKNLNKRWNMVYDRHVYYAKICYYLLHKNSFELKGKDKMPGVTFDKVYDSFTEIECSPEESEKVSMQAFNEEFRIKANHSVGADGKIIFSEKTLKTMPLYCFEKNKRIDDNNKVDTISTNEYFKKFYRFLIVIISFAMISAIGVFLIAVLVGK